MLLKVLSLALLVAIGETAYSGYPQPNQGGVHVPQPLPCYPTKPPPTANPYPGDYPDVKPVERPRRPRQPGHGLPSEGHHRHFGSVEDVNSYHNIDRVYDEGNDDDESQSYLETHDWLPPTFRLPGELRSAVFAFPAYIVTVKVKVAEVITDTPYIAIQAIRYRQGAVELSREDYVQVIVKHPAQIVHVNVEPEMLIQAHEELFTYVPIKREGIDFRQYSKKEEQEKDDNKELPGIEWQEAGEIVVKAAEN